MTPTRFTKNDMAKYPFLKENTDYIKKLNLARACENIRIFPSIRY